MSFKLTDRGLRLAVLGLAAGETAFWLYCWFYVTGHANPRGDGMELLAMVPMTFILLALVVPAVVLGIVAAWFPLAAKIGAGFAAVALIADVVVWIEILGEFAHKTAR